MRSTTIVGLVLGVGSVASQHPIKRCNVTWAAPTLPAGIFVPTAPEYTCILSAYAYPPDFNATWPCAAVGHKQCSAKLPGYADCAETECYNKVTGPGNKCADTSAPECVCPANLLCSHNEPPPTKVNEGCTPMFVHNCPKKCGIFVPCSA